LTLADVAVRVVAALGEERVGAERHAVPDVEAVVDDQLGQEGMVDSSETIVDNSVRHRPSFYTDTLWRDRHLA
jgi:hypothetical protein